MNHFLAIGYSMEREQLEEVDSSLAKKVETTYAEDQNIEKKEGKRRNIMTRKEDRKYCIEYQKENGKN